jgi:hypothetical protein
MSHTKWCLGVIWTAMQNVNNGFIRSVENDSRRHEGILRRQDPVPARIGRQRPRLNA